MRKKKPPQSLLHTTIMFVPQTMATCCLLLSVCLPVPPATTVTKKHLTELMLQLPQLLGTNFVIWGQYIFLLVSLLGWLVGWLDGYWNWYSAPCQFGSVVRSFGWYTCLWGLISFITINGDNVCHFRVVMAYLGKYFSPQPSASTYTSMRFLWTCSVSDNGMEENNLPSQ